MCQGIFQYKPGVTEARSVCHTAEGIINPTPLIPAALAQATIIPVIEPAIRSKRINIESEIDLHFVNIKADRSAPDFVWCAFYSRQQDLSDRRNFDPDSTLTASV